MKRNIIKSVILIVFFGTACIPYLSATLIDRGFGLIYDDDLDITWMQYTNTAVDVEYCLTNPGKCSPNSGLMTYQQALDFVEWFNNVYVPPWPAGEKKWRLPVTPTAPDMSCSQNFNSGYGCTQSELGHLYYVELGNTAGEGGFTNHGPFRDIEIDMNYWSDWDFVSPGTPAERMTFKFRTGLQVRSENSESHYVWLVHDGDIALRTQCNDARDNDGDGAIDMQDSGCTSPDDNNERIVVRQYRYYPLEFIPIQALQELWLGDWPLIEQDIPCMLPLCPDPPLAFSQMNNNGSPVLESLNESIWKISKSDSDPKLLSVEINNFQKIISKIPMGTHYNKEMKGKLTGWVNAYDTKNGSFNAGEYFSSGILVKALNAIELDSRLPALKPQSVKTGVNAVNIGGLVWVNLRKVEKPGDISLNIIGKYLSFPADMDFSPGWPFFTYQIEFTGSTREPADLSFYVGA
jgi:hypothetical protein